MYEGGFVPSESSEIELERVLVAEAHYNQFMQEREYKILLHNDCNLTSFNGLDVLEMILRYTNY
jgi:hypothetical protein